MEHTTTPQGPTAVMLITRFDSPIPQGEPVYVTAELIADRWYPCVSGVAVGSTDGYATIEDAAQAWRALRNV